MGKKLRITIFLLSIAIFGALYTQKPLNLGLDLQGGTRLVLEAQDTKEYPVDQDTVSGILSVIRDRVNALGVSEPVIQRKGIRQIVVELPGIKDPERAIALIGETALLEFIEAEWPPKNILSLDKEKQDLLVGKDANIIAVEEKSAKGEILSSRPIILKNRVLTGSDLKRVNPGTDNYGRPIVNIEFTAEAARIFYDVTSRSIGKPIAILLDGKVISAPNVNGAIPGGKAIIEGGFTVPEMRDLVIKLKAGSLPVPVEIVSNTIVGPTLGKDSIEKSRKAGIIGLGIVCAYMLVAYRISGIIAAVALILYLLVLIATLKTLGATLTLPGIAGIILTIGMAVDANVIIFERIKEQLRVGDTIRSAIKTGFAKALVAIIDANITTLIAAIVLFWIGTGSIKGFALTLSIGILVSMFSALFITKLLLELAPASSKLLFGLEEKQNAD